MLNTGLAGKRDTKWSADATKQLGIGTQAISPDQLTQLSISTQGHPDQIRASYLTRVTTHRISCTLASCIASNDVLHTLAHPPVKPLRFPICLSRPPSSPRCWLRLSLPTGQLGSQNDNGRPLSRQENILQQRQHQKKIRSIEATTLPPTSVYLRARMDYTVRTDGLRLTSCLDERYE